MDCKVKMYVQDYNHQFHELFQNFLDDEYEIYKDDMKFIFHIIEDFFDTMYGNIYDNNNYINYEDESIIYS
jgi:hypothetical protein